MPRVALQLAQDLVLATEERLEDVRVLDVVLGDDALGAVPVVDVLAVDGWRKRFQPIG